MAHAILDRLVRDRDQINSTINDILDQAESDERDPSESERELIARHRARLDQLEPQIRELVDLEERRAASTDAHAVIARGVPGRNLERVSAEPVPPQAPMQYRTFAQWARDELIVRYPEIAMRAGDNAAERARERLRQAMLLRSGGGDPPPAAPAGSTLLDDIPGLVPPQHMAQIMEVISTSRPLVEAARAVDLSTGKLTYPRITQRPQVGMQQGEKTPLPIRPMQVGLEEIVADVYGGAGDLSWQTLNWTTPNALGLWFDLAAEAYAQETETVAAAALGDVTQSVAVASDDLAGWVGAIAAAAGTIFSSVRRSPNTLITDVTTGYGLLGLVSDQAPVFFGAGNANLAQGSGTIAGLRLLITYGFSAPAVYVGVIEQLVRGENAGAPVQMRAVEPSIAGMEVGIIGAFAAKVIEPGAFVELTPPTRAVSGGSGGSSSTRSSSTSTTTTPPAPASSG
ncbi:MAG: hypothetical protein J2P59_02040 [Acidimicrobiales bacterium]|nr:hypothetical protein [Acidimicrobiales bacterium]